jgi:amino acid transporter, AAT family
MENSNRLFVEERRLVKRWPGPIPALVNLLIMAAFFYLTWWIFQDPRGIMRLYTPYKGYMICRWLLIMFIWVAYIFDFWPFSRKWLRNTHPLWKGTILTLISVGIFLVLLKGFFHGLLGRLSITYFSPERMADLGMTEFYAEEYAATAILMFAAIASWLSPAWVAAAENAPWTDLKQPVKGFSVLILTFFLSTLVYFATMHPHMGILYYPWQEFTSITPPWWETFADTVSGNFNIAWIMCCTVVVWLYETIWERYPFNLIKTPWLRRTAAFFGILLIALALNYFLYYGQELIWGEAIRGTRRLEAPDWRWLHVGEMAIFWLVPALFMYMYAGNYPTKYSKSVNVLLRTLISIAAAIVLYIVYYKTAHLFLGTQKGFSHPQQFPMIPMIWLINIFLINFWFMDGWPGWRLSPVSESEVAEEATESWSWNPPLAWGVVSGLVIGVVVYVLTINLLPWIGQHFTIIK